MLPQRAPAGQPTLQRVVRPRHGVLQTRKVRTVGVPLQARALHQLQVLRALLLPRNGATRGKFILTLVWAMWLTSCFVYSCAETPTR